MCSEDTHSPTETASRIAGTPRDPTLAPTDKSPENPVLQKETMSFVGSTAEDPILAPTDASLVASTIENPSPAPTEMALHIGGIVDDPALAPTETASPAVSAHGNSVPACPTGTSPDAPGAPKNFALTADSEPPYLTLVVASTAEDSAMSAKINTSVAGTHEDRALAPTDASRILRQRSKPQEPVASTIYTTMSSPTSKSIHNDIHPSIEIAAHIAGTAENAPVLNDRILRPLSELQEPVTSTIETIPRLHPTILQRLTILAKPDRNVGEAPSFYMSIRSIVLASWLNILLVFIPVSWALHFALKKDLANRDTIVFITSFLAIIPLAQLLTFATEELSIRVGQTLAGLLNVTLGNTVELIVAILALTKCELRVVQASLVGSILSNLLLVLGICFFAGGLKYFEQGFGASATQVDSSLLTLSVIAVLLPAAYHLSTDGTDGREGDNILALSRGASIILLFIYGAYLVFQLYSHTFLYGDHGDHIRQSVKYNLKPNATIKFREGESPENGAVVASNPDIITASGDVEYADPEVEEEENMPQMNVWTTIGLLIVVTVLVAVTAEFLVDSIHGMTESGGIRQEFIGIILLPVTTVVGSVVFSAVISIRDKLTLC